MNDDGTPVRVDPLAEVVDVLERNTTVPTDELERMRVLAAFAFLRTAQRGSGS